MILILMFLFILLALLVFISPMFVAYFFFVAICIVLLWMLKQKEIAYALVLIFGMSTVIHVLDYVHVDKNAKQVNPIDKRLERVENIVDKVYYITNNPVQDKANSVYEKFVGGKPKILKGDENDGWFGK